MGWLGIEEKCLDEESFLSFLKKNRIEITSSFNLEIKTEKESWVKFKVYEVTGFIEGLACNIASIFNCPALEAGKHLILGEISAKLWDEAVKICYPGGEEKIIVAYTYDAFLDIRMPTKNVRGISPQIVISGKSYNLPLSLDDLIEIARLGKTYLQKIEKAASVYGIEKIISKEALDEIKRLSREKKEEEITYEVDYDEGYVFVMTKGKLSTYTIPRFVVFLLEEGKKDEAVKIFEKCNQRLRSEIIDAVEDLFYLYKSSGKDTKVIEEFLNKLKEETKTNK